MLDPARDFPLVCISIRRGDRKPPVDPHAMAETVGDAGAVYVFETGDASRALSARLPDRLDVYGGATRLWWPLEPDPDPADHPLFFVHKPMAAVRVVQKIADALESTSSGGSARLNKGDELPAVVTRVHSRGAELRLTGSGKGGFAPRSALSTSGLEPWRVVRTGQAVRLEITENEAPGSVVGATLLPFEPDQWSRLAEQYEVGSIVEGIVAELRNFGAFVDLLPAVRCLLHRSKIDAGWVSHPEDFVSVGDRIICRLVRLEPAERKAELSMLNLPSGIDVPRPASIYPDGPPWLDPRPVEEQPIGASETEAEASAKVAAPASEAEEQTAGSESVPGPEPREEVPQKSAAEPAARGESVEAERLETAIAASSEVGGEVAGRLAAVDGRLAELRGEAAAIRRGLERDLVEARSRILELAEAETSELVGSTERALNDARADVARLTAELRDAVADRRELLRRAKDDRRQATVAQQEARRLRRELAAERDRTRELRNEVTSLLDGPENLFLHEMRKHWEDATEPDDRGRYPWREPVLGPAFLDSLGELEGVSANRVTEVCSQVACGRAKDISALALHRLRESEGAGAAQITRADGARAWRCNLQTNTAAARRLHYWELTDGTIELAKIGYHDDMSIS